MTLSQTREGPLQELPEGTVTVLFTDAVGSTELTNRLGDDAARSILSARDELARRQIERHRGIEVKGTGDGLMVAFTSARRAVACAVDIQRGAEALNQGNADGIAHLRIGLNTGEVIREEADLFGATVNAAQRIASHAAGGEILVSEGVRMVLGAASSVELEDRGDFELKGFPDRWRLHAVVWREQGVLPSGRTPYVGREEERAELRRRMEDALDGRGTLVMIGGEPGVGKTRIAEELMAQATERGMLALMGHCYEVEGAVPYIPYVEILESATRTVSLEGLRTALGESAPEVAKLLPELRKLFPDIPLPPDLPPDQERRYLFNGMREYLRRASQAQPLLFVLDDLHWADDSTLQLLQHLAQDLHQERLLIVGTYRDVELDVGRPLARMLETLLRQRLAHRISLRRLPEGAVAAMLRALSGQEPPSALVDAVFRETEGNPFFVEEVFHHLAEERRLFDHEGRWRSDLNIDELDVPEGVRLVVGRRLERVGDECRRALGAAAVIGRRFPYDLLEMLGEVEPDALLDAIDDAQRAHLIVAEEGRKEAWFTFAHELIRQTLLSSLSLPRRQRMHLRVADTLERWYGASASDHAADLAHHLYQAGAAADPGKACHYLALAGQQALDAAAFEEAAHHFDLGMAVLGPEDRGQRAELLFRRGLAVRSIGKWEDALNDWREALSLYEGERNGVGAAELCFTMSEQLSWSALWVEARECAARGLALLDGSPTFERGRLLGFLGWTTALGLNYAEGMARLDEANRVALDLGDEHLLGWILGIKASVNHWYLLPNEGLEDGLRAIALLRSSGDLWQLVDSLFINQYGYALSGRLDEGEALGKEAVELANRLGHLGGVMAARRGLETARLIRTGDFDAAEQFVTEDLELARQANMPWISNAYTNLGMLHFWRGRWQEALTEFQTAVSLEPPGMLDGWDSAHAMVAKAYVGDGDGALAVLENKRHLLPKLGEPNCIGSWSLLAGMIEALPLLGRREEAAAAYQHVLEALATGCIVVWPTTLLQTVAGIAAGAGRDWARAEEHFEAALRQAHDIPAVIAQPETRRWYAWMLLERDASNDRERARDLLDKAVQMYTRLGMPRHAALANERLARP